MIWAIDPIVFELAASELRCAVVLEHIAENIEKAEYRIAIDGNGLLEKYLDIFERYLNDPSPNVQPIVRILAPIIKGTGGSFSVTISTPILEELKDVYDNLIDFFNCRDNIVESQLLAIAFNSRKEGVATILLPEEELLAKNHIRSTGFYTPSGSREITKALSRQKGISQKDCWFSLKGVDDFVKVGQFEETVESPAHMHSEKFEMKVIDKLRSELNCFSPVLVPYDVKEMAGQVDVYIESEDVIWVGECKLRDRGNEENRLNGKEMGKICRVIEATIRSKKPPKIYGYLISNASGVHDYAQEVLQNYVSNWQAYTDTQIQVAFRKAVLPNDWPKRDMWNILRLEPSKVLFESE